MKIEKLTLFSGIESLRIPSKPSVENSIYISNSRIGLFNENSFSPISPLVALYDAPGVYIFEVPEDVSVIQYEVVGARGGPYVNYGAYIGNAEYGQGIKGLINVTNLGTLTLSVGARGKSASGNAYNRGPGQSGSPSSLGSIIAEGGSGSTQRDILLRKAEPNFEGQKLTLDGYIKLSW